MDGSIHLSAHDRKTLLEVYRNGPNARVARRAHLLLLLGEGHSYRLIMQLTYTSADTIAHVKTRFLAGGVQAALAESDDPPTVPYWHILICQWLLTKTPQDFGFFRQRWSAALLAALLEEEHGIRISAETVRRGLHALGFVWRRPRPVVGPTDPEHAEKVRRIARLLARLPANETAVFQDEVDIHLNPKIGSCWMPRGEQAEVVTPGNNEKRHVAGSLAWRTGRLFVSPPHRSRNSELFVAHLDDLRRRLRGYRKIHVILDNAPFHRSGPVDEYLARWGHRIKLHFLPKYAPETNPIERVWWRLHETVTRNHRCATIDILLREVYQWTEAHRSFSIPRTTYCKQAA